MQVWNKQQRGNDSSPRGAGDHADLKAAISHIDGQEVLICYEEEALSSRRGWSMKINTRMQRSSRRKTSPKDEGFRFLTQILLTPRVAIAQACSAVYII